MKKFKTESQRMLDLMINSIYTNREIFIRELISNASDAIDKLYFKSLSDDISGLARSDFFIQIDIDKQNRVITISDNGIGMTAQELENNLGTIAKSGSLDFKNNIDKSADVSIIGQFGVGFYSGFMVSDKVEVVSRAYGSESTSRWVSSGAEGYEISSGQKDCHGTTIILHIKPDTDEENYSEFLDEYRLKSLIKKYSDYITYPIKMEVTKYEKTDADEKHVDFKEMETVNSMVPLWKKQRSEVSDEEYNNFYKEKFFEYEDALKIISFNVEGAVDYKALLFIPKSMPVNYYNKGYEKGLMLYTNGVLITEKCSELLPDHYGFIRGVVDSQLTLNISRETVQQNRQLKAIAQSIEKKIGSELASLQKNDRENYNKFFDNFGVAMKYGVYSSFGANSDKLKDLIMFKSVKTGEYITLREYRDSMTEEQKNIIYSGGKTVEGIKAMPQTELLLEKGYDVLCFTEEVDEFAIKVLREYDGKQFKSIESGLDDTLESAPVDEKLAEKIMKRLDGRIVKVKGSKALKNHAVCLSSDGEVSIEMEKVFSTMPDANKTTARKVLEINVDHPFYKKMLDTTDDERLDKMIEIIYQQARLIQGLAAEDVVKLTEDIVSVI